MPGMLGLSQSNQILINGFRVGQGTTLLDVNTGVTTPISQLVSPTFVQQFPVLIGKGIDDRGDILVEVGPTDGLPTDPMYLLTPAGLSAPTPEPSSLLVFGLVAGAMGLRSVFHRFRGRSSS